MQTDREKQLRALHCSENALRALNNLTRLENRLTAGRRFGHGLVRLGLGSVRVRFGQGKVRLGLGLDLGSVKVRFG